MHVAVENVRYVTTERDSIYGIEMKFRRDYDDAYTGCFTLFLNEDLVDLSRPVTIIVNGRQLYWGMLTANTRRFASVRWLPSTTGSASIRWPTR